MRESKIENVRLACSLFTLLVIAACSSGDMSNAPAMDNNKMSGSGSQMTNGEMQNPNEVGEGSDSAGEDVVETNPDVGEPAKALGSINFAALQFFSEFEKATSVEARASLRFHELATPLNNNLILKPMVGLDTCAVGESASQISAEFLDLPIDHIVLAQADEVLQPMTVSAGQTVEVSSSMGSFMSLSQTTSDAGILNYSTPVDAPLNVSLPAMITIDSMGADFPAMKSSWQKPAVVSSDVRSAIRNFDETSSMNWSGLMQTSALQSRLHIYAGDIDEVTGKLTSYECVLNDDGNFTLPSEIQSLYQNGFKANFVSAARYSRSLQYVDGQPVVSVFLQGF